MVIFCNRDEDTSKGIIDFDQFKDNAFTRFGKSLIFKFSIKDFASETNTNIFNGLSINFCACFAEDEEFSEPFPSLAIVRVCFNNITHKITSHSEKDVLETIFDKEIDMSPLIEDLDSEELKRKLFHTWSFSLQAYGTPHHNSYASMPLNPICFTIVSNGKVRALVKYDVKEGTIIPCVSYGMNVKLKYNNENHIPYCINNIQCGIHYKNNVKNNPMAATVASASKLSNKLKQLYPSSWSSLCPRS